MSTVAAWGEFRKNSYEYSSGPKMLTNFLDRKNVYGLMGVLKKLCSFCGVQKSVLRRISLVIINNRSLNLVQWSGG